MKVSVLKVVTGFTGEFTEDHIPIVEVVPRNDLDYGWMFWCKFCGRVHRHGEGLGDRASHCFKSSPYTSYVLVEKKQLPNGGAI